ncbi:hypothetical protein C1H76_3738 [Elsinoe australis]|uniref:Uncharacterized protein n=1 Tax=Elsinoe australis TaxID=40998 RepID=A0A4U7B7C4_9PEZI|nr:hypothetical protein C1H76_3738 [Elsinoe australis]
MSTGKQFLKSDEGSEYDGVTTGYRNGRGQDGDDFGEGFPSGRCPDFPRPTMGDSGSTALTSPALATASNT